MGRLGLAAVGALGLWSSPANAAEQPPVASFVGPEECLDAQGLSVLIERNSTVTRPPNRFLHARVEQVENGYRVELALEENSVRRGTRVVNIEGSDCHADDASLGLIAAMLLEGPVEANPKAADEKVPTPAPAPSSEPETSRPSEEPAEATPRTRFGFSAAAGLSYGLQPGVAPGVVVGVVVELPRWFNVRADTAYFFPTSSAATGPAVEIDQMQSGAALCGRWRPGALQLETCVGGQVLLLWAAGRGFGQNQRSDVALGALSVMERISWPLGRSFRIGAAGGVVAPLSQVTFGGNWGGMDLELFETARVTPRFELGGEFFLD